MALLCVVLVLLASNARAQSTADIDPSDLARFRFGPLRFTPSLVVSNLGTDDNVFNESENQRKDTTAAVGPATDLWLRLGRARLSGKTSGQYLYFKEYKNQRSWNTRNEARLELPAGRFKPFIGGAYTNTRDRPGYEIDARARLRNQSVSAGMDIRVSGKTTLMLGGMQSRLSYDQNETFLGVALANALDRQTRTEQLQLRYGMTPLTTFVTKADAIQDRFSVDTRRNADGIQVLSGFEFKPFALISGSALVGFKHFNVLDDSIPDFDGIVASVNARYVIRATQFDVRVARDITFSYEFARPYYALTDVGLTVTQRITRVWDVVGRGGRQTLAYRIVNGTNISVADSVDDGIQYGGGIGYRVGETVRLGVDVAAYKRRSKFEGRSYDGLRIGASIAYGLTQ